LTHGSTNPLHADYYADQACFGPVPVVLNDRIARDTYRLRIACPEIAQHILPGQFVMLRLAGQDDPLLGRPLALYDTVPDASGTPTAIDIVYLVLGKMTGRLAHYKRGQELEVWGPLGNGFMPRQTEHLILVAGGIGQTPFLALGQEYLARRHYGDPPRNRAAAEKVTLCYGVRTADYQAGVCDFENAGIDVRMSSDDGTIGHHGLVTDVLRQVLTESTDEDRQVACCGPEPMMEAVAEICNAANVPCQVSLETPMACGIGICFSCVVKRLQPDGSWDYQRTCVSGPVFDAEEIVW